MNKRLPEQEPSDHLNHIWAEVCRSIQNLDAQRALNLVTNLDEEVKATFISATNIESGDTLIHIAIRNYQASLATRFLRMIDLKTRQVILVTPNLAGATLTIDIAKYCTNEEKKEFLKIFLPKAKGFNNYEE